MEGTMSLSKNPYQIEFSIMQTDRKQRLRLGSGEEEDEPIWKNIGKNRGLLPPCPEALEPSRAISIKSAVSN